MALDAGFSAGDQSLGRDALWGAMTMCHCFASFVVLRQTPNLT